jgi:anaerobic magnesium-protoporphyrin IX monomethyl ester cyclase
LLIIALNRLFVDQWYEAMDHSSNIHRVMLVFPAFPPSTALVGWRLMVTPPMGIAYLASAVRNAGYEVACLDMVVEAPFQETVINGTVSRLGLTYDQTMEKIAAWKPDVVGLSCIFSNQWPATRELAKRIKAADSDVIVVAGGGHPTFLSQLCMEDAPLDFIIRGEGEEGFVELLNRIRKSRPLDDVDGLVYRDGDFIRANPKVNLIEDLDSIAFPAHDLLDLERYFKIALPMGYSMMSPRNVPIVTSRGCPCHCTFCSSTYLWGKQYRTRSASNVLQELDWLVDKFRIEEIKVQDDNLTVNKKRVMEIFRGMIERPYHLHWNTPNGIAIWTLDKEMLTMMKDSGCFEMTMAIESGNQNVLDNLIRKPLKLDKVREINKVARELGIVRIAYFLIGFPGETKEQIMDTIKFSRELRLDLSAIFLYNQLPGSELFERCAKNGSITERGFFEIGNQYFSAVVDSDEWTSKQLEILIHWEHLRNYLAIFRSPYLVARMYYKAFRYQPSFFKFFLLRTSRAIRLKLMKGDVREKSLQY